MAFFSSPLRPILASFRYAPAALPLLGCTRAFSLLNQTPTSSSGAKVVRALPRQPFAGAPRECPTPVILVRAHGLGELYGQAIERREAAAAQAGGGGPGEEEEDWSTWAGMFAERGYTTLEVDVTAPTASHGDAAVALDDQGQRMTSSNSSSTDRDQATAVLQEMSKLLASQIRLLAIPFAPIVISEGYSSWLAQAYVEDNPASGLVMIDPAPSAGDAGVDSSTSPKFGYEPHFPVLILASGDKAQGVKESRVGRYSEQGVGRGGKGVTIDDAPHGARSEKRRIVSIIRSSTFSGDVAVVREPSSSQRLYRQEPKS